MISVNSRLFQPSRRTLSTGLLGVLTLAFLWVGSSAWAAPSEYKLHLSDGDKEISELAIGDDLWVSASYLPRNMDVKIELLDGAGQEVSAVTSNTGPLGVVDTSLLWFRSGILGCDPSSGVDPLKHRFIDYSQADVFLKGLIFKVRILDPLGWPLIEKNLPLIIQPQTRYFFSDGNGCPRSVYELHEDVYLSAVYATPGFSDTAIFFVDARNPLSTEGLIQEVRPAFQVFPQVLPPAMATGDWTTIIWRGADSQAGVYGAFIRRFMGSIDLMWDPLLDLILGLDLDDGRGPHGITIKTWSCPAGDPLCDKDEK